VDHGFVPTSGTGAYRSGLLGATPGERDRLGGSQSAVDAFTVEVIEGLAPDAGVALPGTRCGAGSIVRRLGTGGRDPWRPLVAHVAPAMLAAGLLVPADLARFDELLDDPAVIDLPQITLAVWGRRDVGS
jgi:hypothetical protein